MTETFNFPYHKIKETHPDSGYGLKFGNSYQFRSAPSAPDQITYTLTMMGMRYIKDPMSGLWSRVLNPTVNALFLKDFYIAHKLWRSFFYVHPAEGTLLVRFKEPLELPTALDGGSGLVPEFNLVVETQP